MKNMLGVRRDSNFSLPMKEWMPTLSDLPTNFDSREKWYFCPSIREVRDQGCCGSCWAFGAVEAITDRICIASNGKVTDDVSAEDLLSCCDSCGDGCNGGDPAKAWNHWTSNGIVTGGLYKGTGCRPYSIQDCGAYDDEPETPECKKKCVPDYPVEYDDDKTWGQRAYQVSGVEQIQRELMDNGPLEVVFKVFEDFMKYKSGVYQRHTDEFQGYHAVKLIGWGEENGIPYWLCTNSWNANWGDGGFFKILRGSNECDIESYVVAGLPDLYRRKAFLRKHGFRSIRIG